MIAAPASDIKNGSINDVIKKSCVTVHIHLRATVAIMGGYRREGIIMPKPPVAFQREFCGWEAVSEMKAFESFLKEEA